MRWTNYVQIFGERKITNKNNNQMIWIVLIQIYSMKVKLVVVKFDNNSETNQWSIVITWSRDLVIWYDTQPYLSKLQSHQFSLSQTVICFRSITLVMRPIPNVILSAFLQLISNPTGFETKRLGQPTISILHNQCQYELKGDNLALPVQV